MSSSTAETRLGDKAGARRPSGFLVLAPATSSSYPQMPVSRPAAASGAEPSSRRSSSASITGPRVLKLGPVHWGEHLDEHKGDFSFGDS
ncbi:hypothetical protein G6O67_002160 [Ophiocordyceps sinensis]|uniref:Uncharacterized protein n=1 Tax=Ophiocordyceps sinensis TaxID=72228 RepID=A0A8H4V6Z3_9HYPO|nr:hypothetical protein G6O67_002160 [Ophiocordyceps sinensis]